MISLPVRDTRDFAPIRAFVVRGSPRDTHAGAEKVRQETSQDEETFRLRCIIGDPDGVAEQAQALLHAGLEGLMVFTSGLWTPEDVALAGEAIAQLHP